MYHTLETKTENKITISNSQTRVVITRQCGLSQLQIKRAMFSINRVNIEPELEGNKQMMATLTWSIDGTLTTPSQENIPKCPHRSQAK